MAGGDGGPSPRFLTRRGRAGGIAKRGMYKAERDGVETGQRSGLGPRVKAGPARCRSPVASGLSWSSASCAAANGAAATVRQAARPLQRAEMRRRRVGGQRALPSLAAGAGC